MPRCAFQKGPAQWLGKVNYRSVSVTTAVLVTSPSTEEGGSVSRVPLGWGQGEREPGSLCFSLRDISLVFYSVAFCMVLLFHGFTRYKRCLPTPVSFLFVIDFMGIYLEVQFWSVSPFGFRNQNATNRILSFLA